MSILFNSRTPKWSWLSNFSPHTVGTQPTAEHAYHACKFTDPHWWSYIRSTGMTPAQVKRMMSLDHVRRAVRPDWQDVKLDMMRSVIRRKFREHIDLAQKLIATGDQELLHYAPWGDTFWGVNKDLVGMNWQGKIIMEIRDEYLHP